MKRYVIIVLLVCTGFAAMAQDGLVRSLAEACANMESVKCSFVQTRHVSMLDNDIISKGRMSYSKPDVLVWEYTSPEVMSLEMNGPDIRIRRGAGQESVDISGNRMFRELTKLLYGAVSGKLITDDRLFDTEVDSDGKVITAKLTPKKGDLKQMWSCMTMHFEPETYRALSIDIDEAGGDTTKIIFSY